MTAKLTESAIEEFAIRLLERLGYVHLHGPDIAPDGEAPERGDYAKVLLAGRLERAVARINPHLASDLRQEAIRELQRAQAPELLAGNEALHRLFTATAADELGLLTFLDLDQQLVDRELARQAEKRRSGPHAENMLRDIGVVAARPT